MSSAINLQASSVPFLAGYRQGSFPSAGCYCLSLGSEVASLEPEGNVDQADHHWHFHQGTDNRGKGRPGVDAADRHRHGDGELKVIAGGGEGQGSGFTVVGPD